MVDVDIVQYAVLPAPFYDYVKDPSLGEFALVYEYDFPLTGLAPFNSFYPSTFTVPFSPTTLTINKSDVPFLLPFGVDFSNGTFHLFDSDITITFEWSITNLTLQESSFFFDMFGSAHLYAFRPTSYVAYSSDVGSNGSPVKFEITKNTLVNSSDFFVETCYYLMNTNADHTTTFYRVDKAGLPSDLDFDWTFPNVTDVDIDVFWLYNLGKTIYSSVDVFGLLDFKVFGTSILSILVGGGFIVYIGYVVFKWFLPL